MSGTYEIDPRDYDTDKSRSYLDAYERELAGRFDSPLALLELGVQRGGSMLLWRDIFPEGRIVGLDLNPVSVPDDTGRISVYQGFQQDRDVLERLSTENAPDGFDVIIDDASHLGKYTADSFWYLFPHHLKRGGVYVLEDWSCAYLSSWTDGKSPRDPVPAASGRPGDGRGPSAVETARRIARASARDVSRRLEGNPKVKAAVGAVYSRADRLSARRRFLSHDFGMVGFLKQVHDWCALTTIDRDRYEVAGSAVSRVVTYPSQAFIYKD